MQLLGNFGTQCFTLCSSFSSVAQKYDVSPHFQTSEFKDSALINKHVDQLLKVLNKALSAKPDEAIEVQVCFSYEMTCFLLWPSEHAHFLSLQSIAK